MKRLNATVKINSQMHSRLFILKHLGLFWTELSMYLEKIHRKRLEEVGFDPVTPSMLAQYHTTRPQKQ